MHIQTIGILVSEKSELQTNVASIQKKLSSKENEILEINNQLKTLRQYVLDLEKNISQYKTTEGQWIQVSMIVTLIKLIFNTLLETPENTLFVML